MRIVLFFLLFFASAVDCRAIDAADVRLVDDPNVEPIDPIVDEADLAEPCPEQPSPNQTLHLLVNTQPLESLVLRAPPIVDGEKKFALVLLVNSAENERADRDEIRRLWAAKTESRMQATGESVVVFLLGRSSALEEEAETYGDLLQVDVEDSYRNMVYKIEAGFRWLNDAVQSDFVAKIDSDTVVHIDRLYSLLRKYDTAQSEPWIACYSIPSNQPVRDKCSPWYISESDYPRSVMPSYCNGPGYAMKRGLFEQIVDRMKTHKVFEVEDAFLTGVVASDVGEIKMMEGVAFHRYTDITDCDADGPTLSMQSTHFQLDQDIKSSKDLAAAWDWLKSVKCP